MTAKELAELLRSVLPASCRHELYNEATHPDCLPGTIRIEIWHPSETEGAFQNGLVHNALRDRGPAGIGFRIVTRLHDSRLEHEHRCINCEQTWDCGCNDPRQSRCSKCLRSTGVGAAAENATKPSRELDVRTFAARMRRRRMRERDTIETVIEVDASEFEYEPIRIPEHIATYEPISYGSISKGLAALKAIEDTLYTNGAIATADGFDGLDALVKSDEE